MCSISNGGDDSDAGHSCFEVGVAVVVSATYVHTERVSTLSIPAKSSFSSIMSESPSLTVRLSEVGSHHAILSTGSLEHLSGV